MKKNLVSKKFLLIILLIIFLVIGCFITFLIVNKKPKVDELSLIDRLTKENLLMEDDKGTYSYKDLDSDVTFEVILAQDELKYTILDSKNNKIETKISKDEDIVTILAPSDGYKRGESYTLSIENGQFKEELLKEVKTVSFSIKKEYKKDIVFKEEVKQIKNGQYKEENNKKYLEVNGEYKVGDILINTSNDEQAAYKVVSASNNEYEVVEATIDEVFDDLRVYQKIPVDVSKYVNGDDLALSIKKKIRDVFLTEVNAVEMTLDGTTIGVDCVNKGNSGYFEVKIKYDIVPKNQTKEQKLKYHKTTISLTFKIELAVMVDFYKEADYYEIALITSATSTGAVNISLIDNETKDYLDLSQKKVSEVVNEALSKYLKKKTETNSDKGEKDVPFPTKFVIPITVVPGLSLKAEFGFHFDFDLRASLNFDLTTTTTNTVGFIFDRGEVSTYKNETKSKIEPTIDLAGTLNIKVGFYANVNLEFYRLIKLGVREDMGFYGKASGSIKAVTTEEYTGLLADFKGSYGFYLDTSLTAFVGIKNYIVVWDKKVPILHLDFPLGLFEYYAPKLKPQEIVLDESKMTVFVGKPVAIKYTVLPEETYDKTVSYYSTDETIVSFRGSELIPLKAGSAKVIFSTWNGKKTVLDVTVVAGNPIDNKDDHVIKIDPNVEKPSMSRFEALTKLKRYLENHKTGFAGGLHDFTGNLSETGGCGDKAMYSPYYYCIFETYDLDNLKVTFTEGEQKVNPRSNIGYREYVINIKTNQVKITDLFDTAELRKVCEDLAKDPVYSQENILVDECVNLYNIKKWTTKSLLSYMDNLYKKAGITRADLIQ